MELEIPNDPVVRITADRARKWRRISWVMVLLIAAWVAQCLEQLFTNTDWTMALKMSPIGAAFASPFMLLILVPVGLIGRAFGNLKPLRRFRWWISLVLPLGLCAWPVVTAYRERMDPARGFKRYLHTNLPSNASHLLVHVNNIILSDLNVSYSFECSRKETERLIQSLNLTKGDGSRLMLAHSLTIAPSTALSGFKNPRHYDNYGGDRYTGFIDLWTDETMTRVYIRKWNT